MLSALVQRNAGPRGRSGISFARYARPLVLLVLSFLSSDVSLGDPNRYRGPARIDPQRPAPAAGRICGLLAEAIAGKIQDQPFWALNCVDRLSPANGARASVGWRGPTPLKSATLQCLPRLHANR